MLKWYYSIYPLFLYCCVGTEIFFVNLYLTHPGHYPSEIISNVSVMCHMKQILLYSSILNCCTHIHSACIYVYSIFISPFPLISSLSLSHFSHLGIAVSLGFFDDIHIPAHLLVNPYPNPYPNPSPDP